MRSLPSLMALEPKDCMPVSKQASLPSSMPRSQSIALIGIDGLLTKIRDCIPHKNKENRPPPAPPEGERSAREREMVKNYRKLRKIIGPKCPKTIQKDQA